MPYITAPAREHMRATGFVNNPGELNYLFTMAIVNWPMGGIRKRLKNAIAAYLTQHTLNYQTLNDILGALDGAHREYVRRQGIVATVEAAFTEVTEEFYQEVVAVYEDEKIKVNGDVYK